MRKHLWADSGEPQVRGFQAEAGIPRKHGKEQSLSLAFDTTTASSLPFP